MTELLLDRKLAISETDSLVRQLARSNTLSAVRQLDGARKGILLSFLYEANLLGEPPIIKLKGADLSGAALRNAKLTGAHLARADLSGADLRNAELTEADLTLAKLREADLSGTGLSGADLHFADLRDANLSGAKMLSVDRWAASLRSTDFRDADLSGSRVDDEDLADALSLVGATMPNGIQMTAECWEESKEGEFQCASP